MTFDFTFFALAVPAVIFAAVSKGGFGSGAAFAATPLLALVLPPEVAVGIMLPLLMLMDFATLGPYWGQWSRVDAFRLIVGAVPGVLVGTAFFHMENPQLLRLLIGSIALAFVAYRLARSRGWLGSGDRTATAPAGYLAGVVAGFTSFVSHAGGPPAAVYLLSRDLSKTAYQATTVLVFWAVNIGKAVPYAFLGMFSADTLKAGLYLAPAALFGVWLGVKAHRVIPERAYFALTYVLLTLTGTKLIWDALT